MNNAQRDVLRKKRVLEHAERIGNVRKACHYFGVSRSSFYLWKNAYESHGEEGLVNRKPCPVNPKLRTPPEVVEKVLHLRRTYHLGPIRIVWYLERYHGIKISDAGVPGRVGRRAVHTHRYAKQVPGHHVQVDVTFLKLIGKDGAATRRYQYTAIDDATRIRALKVYKRHTQKNAIRFLDNVIEKFPFRIHTVRTDRGHEFQAQFH
jgi:transposase